MDNKMSSLTIDNLNTDQKKIISYVEDCLANKKNCQMLIQGYAGTGKSYVIKYIQEILNANNKHCIITSHQAIAAFLIEGHTLYKIFGLFGTRDVARVIKNGITHIIERNGKSYNISKTYKAQTFLEYKNFDNVADNNWLIIDEISMIGLEFLDDMDNILQALFASTKPFGGINFIFLGHFSQLKPVKETPIFKLNTDHFIKHVKLFELNINQRQSNQEFFDLCNGVMKGCLKSEQKRLLKSRLIKNFDYSDLIDLVHIFPTKKLCNAHNISRLLALDETTYYFLKANDIGDRKLLSKEEDTSFNGLYNFVIFSKNAKIMVTMNTESYTNGELYIIQDINVKFTINEAEFLKDINSDDKEYIRNVQKLMLKNNKEIIYCTPTALEIKLTTCDSLKKTNDQIDEKNIDESNFVYVVKNIEVINKNKEKEIRFQRMMYPFQLAWAITTHKIQGISLDEGVIDMGESNFDPVQLYVNISRLRSLDKLYIKDLKLPLPVSPDKPLIKKFIEDIKKNNENNTNFELHTSDESLPSDDDFDFNYEDL